MFLSRLEIFGFKTFAQKIDLVFDAGITNIVGPNGCGKSNVVDALRWALGEQKSSVLRSEKMENVIFNGTKLRKPLNLSEVSITIQNTKNVLPTEYSEVTITRRIYRSGESEYFLNRLPCRLKDINDLFMDTGMGADAYSVIELKMVEQILSDNTEDRRKLFEEAAGITKYKIRRRQTFRKLDSTKQDLMRVNDIVLEIEKKVNSLKRQSQKANRYTRLMGELKWEDIQLATYDYQQFQGRLGPLEERLDKLDHNAEEILGSIAKKEADIEQVQAELIAKEQDLRNAQLGLEETVKQIRTVEERVLVARERKTHLVDLIRRNGEENKNLASRQEALQSKIEDLTRALSESTSAFDSQKSEYETVKSATDAFESQIEQEKQKLEAVRKTLVALIDEDAKKRNAHQLIRNNIQNLEKRILDLETDISTLENLGGNSGDELEDRRSTRQKILAEIETIKGRLTEARSQSERLREELDTLRTQRADVEADIKTLRGRISILQKAIESHEGFPESVRFLLGELKESLEATAADWLSTDKKFQAAIEAALGETFAYVVTRGKKSIESAFSTLANQRKGYATFIDRDKLPSQRQSRPDSLNGRILAWATDVTNSKEPRLTELLIGDVAIVQDFSSASELADAHPDIRFVTLAGEIVKGNYLIKGGSPQQDATHMIGQREALAMCEQEVVQREQDLQMLNDKIVTQESKILEAQLHLQNAERDLREKEQAALSVEKAISQFEYEQRRSGETAARQREAVAAAKNELTDFHRQLTELQPEIDGMAQRRLELEVEVRRLETVVRDLEKERISRSEALQSVQARVWKLESDINQYRSAIDASREQISETTETIRRHEAEAAQSTEEIAHLDTEFTSRDAALNQLFTDRDHREKDRDALNSEVLKIRETVQSMDGELKKIRRQRDELLNSRHQLEQETTTLRFEIRALLERIQRDYDFDLVHDHLTAPEGVHEDVAPEDSEDAIQETEKTIDEVLDSDLPTDAVNGSGPFEPESAKQRIDDLRRKIKALGPVNMEAFSEYESEKERLDVLVQQRQDLLDAESQLLETIATINTTAQQQFMDVFEKIRQNFTKIFTSLFDNSEADLKIADHEDPLEAAIDILARPTGKKTQHIALLSGGEKTLTAISLLFAIYLVKPSPFCILDEVDAPLDDTNIDKFTKLLRDFSSDTQFIVVTHNKRTMEAAQNIFGITMQEAGVSKVVSVSFRNRGEAPDTDDIVELIQQNQVADLTREIKDPPSGPPPS